MKKFQSTAPVWGPTSLVDMAVKDTVISIHGPRVGADRPGQHHAHRRRHFNPRPPCGGRPAAPPGDQRIRVISIHGPRVGADIPLKHVSGRCLISIHGPRVGADQVFSRLELNVDNFNPRPPCGGRQARRRIWS